ncbi:hypothetical protein ACLB2K_053327 [Fragaria x ananassa]
MEGQSIGGVILGSLGVPNFKPGQCNAASNNLNLVSDLISHTGIWNTALIYGNFSVEEADEILSIPLSSREVGDRAAWHLEKNGKFTVKTAYRFSFSTSSSRCPFDLTVRASFWKKIWKLKLPISAKVHARRVCHDILPSSKRVALESLICPLCSNALETTLLLCRGCPFTKQLLQCNDVLYQVCYNPHAMHYNILE